MGKTNKFMNDEMKPLQIALDGPVGSGKETVAVALSRKLHTIHVYTGGMYRSLALYCLRNNIDIHDEIAVAQALKKIEISLAVAETSQTRVLLNGEDVTEEIFFPEVSNITPITSAYKSVREEMVRRQIEISKDKRVIIEGRDIATNVLPNADMKIFLTADLDTRAERRLKQLHDKNRAITFDEVKEDIANRDQKDSERDVSPLQIAKDAFVVDNTHDTIDETIEKILNELQRRGLV